MEKAIITAFMTLAAIVSAVLLFSAVYPAITSGSEAVEHGWTESPAAQPGVIVHAVADGSTALVWVKNVGSDRISAVERTDDILDRKGLCADSVRERIGQSYWEWRLEKRHRMESNGDAEADHSYGCTAVGTLFRESCHAQRRLFERFTFSQ